MMEKLYGAPLRVYLLLGCLALAGILCGLKLPVSLFPNSSKPNIGMRVGYGNTTPEEFLRAYGQNIEFQLRAISDNNVEVEQVNASYDSDGAHYTVLFKWGVSAKAALKEVQSVINAQSGTLPKEIRDSIGSWARGQRSFFAVSFFSTTRSVDEIYKILDPILTPRAAKVPDADTPKLFNPTKKEIQIELKPEAMAVLQLFPENIEQAVSNALGGYGGGSLLVGTKRLSIQMPRAASTLDELGQILVPTPTGNLVHLSDVARIDVAPQSQGKESFRTNGSESVILFATPRQGANVKRMAEDLLQIIHEVAIGAFLAVVILFLFIGSLKNTITAAIEIPMSMVLAFILMRLSGMNLNLISLGGLALSAGMNVDASVVVMENIFRHFEEAPKKLTQAARLKILMEAVNEVKFPVIASTIASLVVFLPLAFTSDLTYAVLGDLAKTVVFSHGFSAIVALVLVPTVRLHLMSKQTGEKPMRSPIEGPLRWLEHAYGNALGWFIDLGKRKVAAYLGLAAMLAALCAFVLPKLPRELVGVPDTDWLILGYYTRGNSLIRQMEAQTEEMETDLLKRYGAKIQYTFAQVNGPNNAMVMTRLKDKRDMREMKKDMEGHYTDTPFIGYWIEAWNPSELELPDPPIIRLILSGGSPDGRARLTRDLVDLLRESHTPKRVSSDPDATLESNVMIRPFLDRWPALRSQGVQFSPFDLADLARVATTGRKISDFTSAGETTQVVMKYPQNLLSTTEDLESIPLGVGSKLVPLKALAQVKIEEVPPTIYREDGRDVSIIKGRENDADSAAQAAIQKKAEDLIEKWKKEKLPKLTKDAEGVAIYFDDAQKDLHEALRQLGSATALSIGLMLITLLLQFGNLVNALLVLVAVPLGMIGVIASLKIFGSTLSLNSVLGVILLNGISVANSIILVDFLKRLVDQGLSPREAAVEAGRKRLRPILITSLTTILGMMPIALGMGEGGRILQPLGISVAGGLWVSMLLTLFIVPALQVSYLEAKRRRAARKLLRAAMEASAGLSDGPSHGLGISLPLGLSRGSPEDSEKAERME